ncbi:MAG: SDR family oxidoreductase [Vulcanimicrobiaceae bacterium]|jgi:NAD(P)-dependent dehydrogenase (short-subunit alcohol dehydrogenase family)
MKVWFVTGSSRGFGHVWVEAALKRGDKVAATARNVKTLDSLVEAYGDNILPLALDVTDKGAVDSAVRRAHERFGKLDIVINNAGYGLFGGIEEVNEAQARAQIETNVFGALWVTQAVLPILRAQRSGHIIQVSSIGGVNAFPNLGLYHASKWALEGFSQSLAAEVRDFGIKVTLIEPGGYTTDWGGSSAVHADPLPAYEKLREAHQARRATMRRGDPEATAPVVLELVDMTDPPLRILFGSGVVAMIRSEYESRLEVWKKFSDLSERAAQLAPA